jgi:hypothetical protein
MLGGGMFDQRRHQQRRIHHNSEHIGDPSGVALAIAARRAA